MKIKTDELIGTQLDWAVATCEGYSRLRENPHEFNSKLIMNDLRGEAVWFYQLKFSSDWGLAGPIIEREKIEIVRGNDLIFPKGNEKGELYEKLWLASYHSGRKFHGTTPLVAAMRAYVASRIGDEIDIPEELK